MRKFTSKACLFLIAILSPVAGYAAGLGRLIVSSVPGQPLNAEIDLVTVKNEEKSSLMARLASQDMFRQANIDYSSVLSTFKTSIETRPDGQLYVRIISPQPITEPLLNMLVELNWSSGRLLREYTVLPGPSENDVHPPAGTVAQAVPPVSAKAEPVTGKSDVSTKQSTKQPTKHDEKSSISDEADSAGKTHTAYGPVKHGDTLIKIAKNIALPAGVSFNQMLVALHRANRDAFFGNNMNQLKTGPVLRIPDNDEVSVITPTEARREVKTQAVDWHRRRFAGMEEATEELKQTVRGKVESAVEVDIIPAPKLRHEILKVSKGEER